MAGEQIRLCNMSVPRTLVSELLKVATSGRITQGPKVQQFEHMIAEAEGVSDEDVVCCTSGTAALHLAMLAVLHRTNYQVDSIYVPAYTYAAVYNVLLNSFFGGQSMPTVMPVDVDEYGVVGVEQLRGAFAECPPGRHSLFVFADTYLTRCDIDSLSRTVRSWSPVAYIIHDVAHSYPGAHRSTTRLDYSGPDYRVFSFYASKIVACGEGGAVVQRGGGPKGQDLLRRLRGQGVAAQGEYTHTLAGMNYRMTELSAVMGIASMSQLQFNLHLRTQLVDRYTNLIRDQSLPVHSMADMTAETLTPWLMAVELDLSYSVKAVRNYMALQGVETRGGFPAAHELDYFWDHLYSTAHILMASRISKQVLCLPTHPGMTLADVDTVVSALRSALWEERRGGQQGGSEQPQSSTPLPNGIHVDPHTGHITITNAQFADAFELVHAVGDASKRAQSEAMTAVPSVSPATPPTSQEDPQ